MRTSGSRRRFKRRSIAALLAIGFLFVFTLSAFRLAPWVREADAEIPGTSRLIPTPFGRVAAQLSGPVDGVPILLAHGSAEWSGFGG